MLEISSIATFVVPENLILLFKDTDEYLKGKKSDNTLVPLDKDDLIRLGVKEADLPILADLAEYTAAHAKADIQNLDVRTAMSNSAAAAFTKMVAEQKVSNATFVSQNYLNDKRFAGIASDASAEAEARAAADETLQGNIDTVAGNLSDLSTDVAATSGSDAISVTGEGATKTIALTLDSSANETLSQSASGLKTELKIAKKGTANAGYAASYQLVDANGTPIVGSADIDMVKDQFLKSVELVSGTYDSTTGTFTAASGEQYNKYIHFVFELTKDANADTAADTDSDIYLDVNSLFDSYTAGDASIVIDQTANTIRVQISASSESVTIGENTTGAVFTLANDGLKIGNIQAAINYAVGVEAARAQAAEADLNTRKVETSLTALGGGRALIFNENDGGGVKVEHPITGGSFNTFIGLNDNGTGEVGDSDLLGQIYAVTVPTGGAANGMRLNILKNKILYTTSGTYAESFNVNREIAVKADIIEAASKKVDISMDTAEGGKALIFNEVDGGGAKIERVNGDAYFVGVNDSDGDRAANHAVASIYALNSTKTGVRFTVFKDMITYKPNATKAERNNPAYEIAVKADIQAAQGNISTHSSDDSRHTAEVEFVRAAATVSEMNYKQYICKAALTGTLPAAPAGGTKRIVSVVAGGEGTTISPASGDTIQGAATPIAINMANDTVTFIYDDVAKDWLVL